MATNTTTMPDRAECVAMIEAVAKGGDIEDLAFMLQAICLELMEMRERDSETVDAFKARGLVYLPHYDGDAPMVPRWEENGFTSRRPKIGATS